MGVSSKRQEDGWEGQVAIITGGAAGLGMAAAVRLSTLGVRVALFDVSEQKLEQAKRDLPDSYGYLVDVRDPKMVNDAVSRLVKEEGRVDILINSAGITGKTNLLSHEVDLSDFDQVIELNVKGCLIMFQAVVPHMLRRGYGRVLHIASIAGKEGNAGMLAYSTSKAAVIGMTKVQGKEYATSGLTVNAIAPAVIRTELVSALPQEQIDYMTSRIPMSRCGTLDEFAEIVTYIASPNASFTTGFTFDLSGGRATY
jgi:3-oxoacyl-[acyl-carrier protein] reductase